MSPSVSLVIAALGCSVSHPAHLIAASLLITAGAAGAYRVTNAVATGSICVAAAESTPMASASSAAVSVKAKSAAVVGVSRLGLRHALLLRSRHRPAEIQSTVHRAPPD